MSIIVKLTLGILILLLIGLLAWRIAAKIHPCPFGAKGLLDNPLRRRFLSAAKTMDWLGVDRNMKVLELGSGIGFLTGEASKRVRPLGRLYCVDIQPEMIAKTREKVQNHNLTNVDLVLADAVALPFREGSFDLAFLVTVLGEIPKRDMALKELNRVLKPKGILSIAEFIVDPHYLLRRTVKALANRAGFGVAKQLGNFFVYTLSFKKI